MTLEEAIKHYEKLAEAGERDAQRWVTDGWQSSFKSLTPEREAQYLSERKRLYNQCLKCAKEHRQLAEWLKELKVVRESWLELTSTVVEVAENTENEDIGEFANFLVNYLGVLEQHIMEEKADDR